MSEQRTMDVSLVVVPSEGTLTGKQVTVAASGATVGHILETAGIDGKNKDVTINGKPATLDTKVGPSDVVRAAERQKPVVKVSERPQGS